MSILGPGLVTGFNDIGIVVSGNNSFVRMVAVTSCCREGIRVLGSTNTVTRNSVSRASLSGGFFAGIFVSGSRGHIISLNEVVGAGPYPVTATQGGHGIFVGEPGTPSINNQILGNNASGNPGSGILFSLGSTGNTVQNNQALGNLVFDDIFDNNNLPGNTYNTNLCQVSSIGSPPVNICQRPPGVVGQ